MESNGEEIYIKIVAPADTYSILVLSFSFEFADFS